MNMTPATIVMQQSLESMQHVASELTLIKDALRHDCTLIQTLEPLIKELVLQSAITEQAIETELTNARKVA